MRRLESTQLRRDLRAIFGDGLAFSIMVGIGEAYLPAFVLALGAPEVWVGLVATIPLAAGSLLQLVSPRMIRILGSRKRWVVSMAVAQGCSFVPLIIGALLGRFPLPLIYFVASLYWGAGMATSPAWNTWIERLVPRCVRIGFLAHRTRAAQIGTLAGVIAGGAILGAAASWSRPLYGFALLFLLAAGFRLMSARFLVQQSEPQPIVPDRIVGTRELLRRTWCGEDGRLLRYLAAMMAGVMIAGPFFTPLMLGPLGFSYTSYMILLAIAFVSKTIALPVLGGVAKRWGARRVLWLGGLGIAPQPFLWLIDQSFPYLLVLQVFSGVAWAAHELAAMLLFFDTMKEEERTSLLTSFNVMNAAATLGGSLLGGGIFAAVGEGWIGYQTVFITSSCLRVGVLALVFRITDRPLHTARMAIRTIAVRPAFGALGRPLLGSLRGPVRSKRLR
jgi:MFS family permease